MASPLDEGPSLDELMKAEADAVEALSLAFIRLSLARRDTLNCLAGLRERLPNVFSNEFDFNQYATTPVGPPLPEGGLDLPARFSQAPPRLNDPKGTT